MSHAYTDLVNGYLKLQLKSNLAVSKRLVQDGWIAGMPTDISRRVLSRTAEFYRL